MTVASGQLEVLRRHLSVDLDRFSDLAFPVDLRRVTVWMNASIRVDPEGSAQHAQAHRQGPGRYEIVVGTRGNPFELPQLRFTIAHEIAHCLIDQIANLTPSSTSEYWQIEDVCNDFAARLLIPDKVVMKLPLDDGATGSEILDAIEETARLGKVSRQVVGRRLGVKLQSLSKASLVAAVSAGTSRRAGRAAPVIIVDWSGGRNSKFAARRHIAVESELGVILESVLTDPTAGHFGLDLVEHLGSAEITVRRFGPSQLGVHISDDVPSALLESDSSDDNSARKKY